MKKKRTLTLLMLALALFLAACQGQGQSAASGETEDSVSIGSVFALTGSVSAYGKPQAQGVKLAVEEINEAGGILGKQINLIEYDTTSENTEAASLVSRLINQDGVPVVLGPDVTGSSLAALPHATSNNVPLVAPSTTGDTYTVDENGNTQEYAWRIAYNDSFQGKALATFAEDNLGAEKVVILGDNSTDYSIGLIDTFTETFGGEIVSVENFSAGQTDFSAVLTNISNMDFDVLFIPGYYEEGGPIIKQAREMGIDQPIIAPDGFANDTLVELAGKDNMQDIYYTTQFTALNADEKIENFLTAYRDRFNEEADLFSAMGYDGMYVVKEAIERAGSFDSQAINDELINTIDFEGITGTFSFDDKHNPIKTVPIIEVQNGEATEVYEIDPASFQ